MTLKRCQIAGGILFILFILIRIFMARHENKIQSSTDPESVQPVFYLSPDSPWRRYVPPKGDTYPQPVRPDDLI